MKSKTNIYSIAVILLLLIATDSFSQSIIGKIGPSGLHKFEISNKVAPFNVFMNINQPNGRITLNNSITLENTVEATSWPNPVGVIYKGSDRFIHNLGGTYLGLNAGNFGHTDGESNTGIGAYCLESNSENASNNTAVGFRSLNRLMFGSDNTSVGSYSLNSIGESYSNTAIGSYSLYTNSGGDGNTAVGVASLYSNRGEEGLHILGMENTAVGCDAMRYNTFGSYNTSLGKNSGSSITTGNNNTAIGYDAQVPDGTLSNQVQIGNDNVSYAGVKVSWTYGSDRRLKSNILNSNLGLNFISKIRPVSYTRNSDIKQKPEYGFIAQEIEDVLKESGIDNSGMITVNDDGIYGLRYNDLLSPMVKAIQELKTENDELKKEIEQFKTVNDKIVKLEKIINELTSIKHTSNKDKEVNLTNSK